MLAGWGAPILHAERGFAKQAGVDDDHARTVHLLGCIAAIAKLEQPGELDGMLASTDKQPVGVT